MEVQGLTNQAEYDRIRALTKVTSPDAARKIAGFLNKVTVILFYFYRDFSIDFYPSLNPEETIDSFSPKR
jgi:hypothetical protein